jgi:hypothetical protein
MCFAQSLASALARSTQAAPRQGYRLLVESNSCGTQLNPRVLSRRGEQPVMQRPALGSARSNVHVDIPFGTHGFGLRQEVQTRERRVGGQPPVKVAQDLGYMHAAAQGAESWPQRAVGAVSTDFSGILGCLCFHSLQLSYSTGFVPI